MNFDKKETLREYVLEKARKQFKNHHIGTLIDGFNEVLSDNTIKGLIQIVFESENSMGMSPEDVIELILEEINIFLTQRKEDYTTYLLNFVESEEEKEEAYKQKPFDPSKTNNKKPENRRKEKILTTQQMPSEEQDSTHTDKAAEAIQINPLSFERDAKIGFLIELIDKYYDELSFWEKEAYKLRILRDHGFFDNSPETRISISNSTYFNKLCTEFGLITMVFSDEEILSLQRRAAIKIKLYWPKKIKQKVREHIQKVLDENFPQ